MLLVSKPSSFPSKAVVVNRGYEYKLFLVGSLNYFDGHEILSERNVTER